MQRDGHDVVGVFTVLDKGNREDPLGKKTTPQKILNHYTSSSTLVVFVKGFLEIDSAVFGTTTFTCKRKHSKTTSA